MRVATEEGRILAIDTALWEDVEWSTTSSGNLVFPVEGTSSSTATTTTVPFTVTTTGSTWTWDDDSGGTRLSELENRVAKMEQTLEKMLDLMERIAYGG